MIDHPRFVTVAISRVLKVVISPAHDWSSSVTVTDFINIVLTIEGRWSDFNIGGSSDPQNESALNRILLQPDLHQLLDASTWLLEIFYLTIE